MSSTSVVVNPRTLGPIGFAREVLRARRTGPGPETVGSPMAPWMTHVAATTHNRQYLNSVGSMTSDDDAGNPPPADIVGLGFTSGFGPAPIVYAGDFPSGLTANCGYPISRRRP